MTKNELSILIQVCDAAISKGGVIAPDAMLTISVARQNALNLVQVTPDGATIIPEKKIQQTDADKIGESANGAAEKKTSSKGVEMK